MWTPVIVTASNRWAWQLSFMRNGPAWRQAWNSFTEGTGAWLPSAESHQSMSKALIRDSSSHRSHPPGGIIEVVATVSHCVRPLLFFHCCFAFSYNQLKVKKTTLTQPLGFWHALILCVMWHFVFQLSLTAIDILLNVWSSCRGSTYFLLHAKPFQRYY